jgi:hypothetical protein
MNLFKKRGPSEFWTAFVTAAKTRGCVCHIQEATETNTNGAGWVEKLAVEPTTTKLILLPGDPYQAVTEKNLVGFQPLNRRFRKMLQKEREKLASYR